jgi:Asp-tRNA(Asn)/Glu-tRNA(Gln) amidotransferase A subunit family amidase
MVYVTATAQLITKTSTICTKNRVPKVWCEEVKRRILVGAYVLSHGYYDATICRHKKSVA